MAQELVWLDLEMTGLDPKRHRIIEIASIITDLDLNIIAEGPDLVIHTHDKILERMNDFVHEMHHSSGLIDEVKNSKITIEEAEKQTLEFIEKHLGAKYKPPLCGNSIGTDRRFLDDQMNKLEQRLHYRVVDVTSIKELVKRWHPEINAIVPPKKENHRALGDIIESIDELKFYRKHLFK
ncbi:MAG: oligoribonuclease [Methanobacteriota archaeon]|jgi:oligoribonuclease|uniref:Oligoribonuclease n=1 Tax=Marine Group III euryarchaeote TaxID=2173149 RepID=A0A7J4GSB3_9ARCH|nr:MAG: oligoribonuclease [Euryarchaeota archaeon]HIF37523.1 oligoribonuclease [Marine Group III euryarchaeote]